MTRLDIPGSFPLTCTDSACPLKSKGNGLAQPARPRARAGRAGCRQEVSAACIPACPAPIANGAIGAAIIRSARSSARMPLRTLAAAVHVSLREARAWETGTVPLYCVPYTQLRAVAVALESGGASLGDLLLASRCDLFLAGMLADTEDFADVPPLESGEEAERALQLLRWALAGEPPEPYSRHARPHPLLSQPDRRQVLTVAADLAAGKRSTGLTSYGFALLGCFPDD